MKNKDVVILNLMDRPKEKRQEIKHILKDGVNNKLRNKTLWNSIAAFIIAIVTIFYGYKIYNSAINLNGKLAWFIERLIDYRYVELTHNNIYEDGVEGIFSDIEEKIDMPDTLYISSYFDLTFDADGTITSFYTYVYGEDEDGDVESYLIDYDSSESSKIRVVLNGYVDANYDSDNLLQPLIETVNVATIEEDISKLNEDSYEMLYYGMRDWGYSTDGIIYVDSEGNTGTLNYAAADITGYTVSVFVPGKEDEYTPFRYILVSDLDEVGNDEETETEEDTTVSDVNEDNMAEEYYLTDDDGYCLVITSAAAGSRSYALYKTTDGGDSWTLVNEDPFSGEMGVEAGITFINEDLGFLCLSKSGGSYGQLYITEDGGETYKQVEIPDPNVTSYNPFDLPSMPYEEDGVLYMEVGQGQDGDYNGNSKALYKSEDDGETWEFVEEVTE